MAGFLEKRDRWHKTPAVWVVAGMICLVPLAWWAVGGLKLENEIENWLPKDDDQGRVLAWHGRHFEDGDPILVSWETSSLDDSRTARLARRLRGTAEADGSPYIDSVITPHDLIEQIETASDGAVDRDEAIRRLEGVLLSRHGGKTGPCAIAVSLSELGQVETEAALNSIRAQAVACGIAADELHIGGRAVAGEELNQQVKKAAWNPDYPLWQLHRRSPLILSTLVGVILAFVMLRSLRLAAMVLLVANFSVLMTVALVPLTKGRMNMVLVMMPTLLSVLAMSAAIHVSNYWRHAACRNRRTAIREAVRMARQPCLLAAFTTAIGLLALVSSPLEPVRDFGLYSAVGCGIALLVVLYGLPSLMLLWPSRRKQIAVETDCRNWKRLGEWLYRRRTFVSVCSLAVFAGCALGLSWFRTETRVIRYFPQQARVVRDYDFFEEQLTGIVPVETIVRFDRVGRKKLNFVERMELVRRIEQRIRNHAEISGALSLADFQPVREPLKRSASLPRRLAYNRKVNDAEETARSDANARAFLALADASTRLERSGSAPLSVEQGDELWRITAQAAITTDRSHALLTRELDEIVRSELAAFPGADHVVTGMVPLFLRTQQAVLDSLLRSFLLAFAVIAVVMAILLRHPIAGLVTMLPNLLPVGVVFGLIAWNGLAVDIGTMITASVALGIAVDGTLHLLTWFRKGIENGLSRRDAVSGALMHCGRAMWQTSVAVGIGLLMLYPADLLLVQRFGWLMAALIGTALVADVILLPALLAGPLGGMIERTIQRSQLREAARKEPARLPVGRPHLLPATAGLSETVGAR